MAPILPHPRSRIERVITFTGTLSRIAGQPEQRSFRIVH
jgi:hypothetical protein